MVLVVAVEVLCHCIWFHTISVHGLGLKLILYHISGGMAGDVYSGSGARCCARSSHRNNLLSLLCPQTLTEVSTANL